jgi:adenylate kinase family enzyme
MFQNRILAHVAGASGSGKTYLGTKIKEKYSFIVKDLDDFNDEILTREEFILSKDKDKYWGENFSKLLNEFISDTQNKFIIFVGYNSDYGNWIDVPTQNKYFIDLPTSKIVKRRYLREKQIKENYYVSSKELRWWIEQIQLDRKEYLKHNYQFLKPKIIYSKIVSLIKSKMADSIS